MAELAEALKVLTEKFQNVVAAAQRHRLKFGHSLEADENDRQAFQVDSMTILLCCGSKPSRGFLVEDQLDEKTEVTLKTKNVMRTESVK